MNILITGSASGIGRATLAKFLAEGHTVFGIDITDAKELSAATQFTADVTSEEALAEVAEELRRRGVTLDVILTVAGVHRMASLVEDSFSDIKKLMDVNLLGTMLSIRTFHPLLSEQGRIIILTSEVGTLAPLPFNGLYSTSKCALEAYAQALRQELNLLGQRVITIRPGAIETPLAKGSISATEALAARTRLYRGQADRFAGIAKRFMGTPIAAEKLARLIYRAAVAKHPRLAYAKHRSAGLLLLNILPKRAQCALIKLLLGKGKKKSGNKT